MFFSVYCFRVLIFLFLAALVRNKIHRTVRSAVIATATASLDCFVGAFRSCVQEVGDDNVYGGQTVDGSQPRTRTHDEVVGDQHLPSRRRRFHGVQHRLQSTTHLAGEHRVEAWHPGQGIRVHPAKAASVEVEDDDVPQSGQRAPRQRSSNVDVAEVEDRGGGTATGAGSDVGRTVEAPTADDALFDQTRLGTAAVSRYHHDRHFHHHNQRYRLLYRRDHYLTATNLSVNLREC